MKISDLLKKNKISFSFEFFPPKTEKASNRLFESIKELAPLKPSYVSVTYGAGGSTRERTHNLVIKIKNTTGLTVVPHLTCVGSTKDEIYKIMERYSKNGIENVLALKGDIPKDDNKVTGEFSYAKDLVKFIKENFPDICIGVAGFPEGHPETPNRIKELDYLKEKVDSGADYICTQLFFDNHSFYDFSDRCKFSGINIPIIAGIMPITTTKGMNRMADLSPGTNFPAGLLKAVNRVENESLVQNVGIHWATRQVFDLIDNNVKGIHFYTLNKSNTTLEIYKSLGIKDSLNFA